MFGFRGIKQVYCFSIAIAYFSLWPLVSLKYNKIAPVIFKETLKMHIKVK